MLRVIDVVYYHHDEFRTPAEVLEKHSPSFGFAPYLKDRIDLHFIKHLNFEGKQVTDGVSYSFFKSRNSLLHIPFKTHRYIRSLRPDVVIIEGLIFPLQLIALKLKLGRKCRLIVQHHGEHPFTRIKKLFQQLSDRYIDKYFFTSIGNASEWISAGIISNANKCVEVQEASTFLIKKDKEGSRSELGLRGDNIYLSVGRLNQNKDPLIVLAAFEKFLQVSDTLKVSDTCTAQPHLYMIYQTQELLNEVKEKIENSPLLKSSVTLVGEVAHEALEYWFSAADYFISGSHKEAMGYAIIEAMACGCIPVVTDIPSFNKITANGEFGFLFAPGDVEGLYQALMRSVGVDRDSLSNKIVEHFNSSLSFRRIAEDLNMIISGIQTKIEIRVISMR